MVSKRPNRDRNMGSTIKQIKQKYQTGKQSEKEKK